MNYVFYCVVVISIAALGYKFIEEIFRVKFPEPNDPTELIEARAENQALETENDFLKKYAGATDTELRSLQKVFAEKVGRSL